jgi:nitrogen fixation-related uncharacterized protein
MPSELIKHYEICWGIFNGQFVNLRNEESHSKLRDDKQTKYQELKFFCFKN